MLTITYEYTCDVCRKPAMEREVYDCPAFGQLPLPNSYRAYYSGQYLCSACAMDVNEALLKVREANAAAREVNRPR